jgi:hypothetical protein
MLPVPEDAGRAQSLASDAVEPRSPGATTVHGWHEGKQTETFIQRRKLCNQLIPLNLVAKN